MLEKKQPWNPADATVLINEIANDATLNLSYTVHAKQRLSERGLISSDLLYVLRHGMVFETPSAEEQSTIPGRYKYKIESQTPNSGSRSVRAVVIPDHRSREMKIITIMWRDEN